MQALQPGEPPPSYITGQRPAHLPGSAQAQVSILLKHWPSYPFSIPLELIWMLQSYTVRTSFHLVFLVIFQVPSVGKQGFATPKFSLLYIDRKLVIFENQRLKKDLGPSPIICLQEFRYRTCSRQGDVITDKCSLTEIVYLGRNLARLPLFKALCVHC